MPVLIATPRGAREMEGLRTLRSKTFDVGGDKRRLIQRVGAVHYPGEGGEWRTVDTDLRAVGGGYQVRDAWFDLDVAGGEIAYAYESKQGGAAMVRLMEIGDRPVAELSLCVEPEAEGNTITWREVVPGVDFRLEVLPARVRLWKVIRAPDAPHALTWEIAHWGLEHSTLQTETGGRDNVDRVEVGPERAGDPHLWRQIEIVHQVEERQEGGWTVLRHREAFSGRTAARDARTRVRRWEGGKTIYPVIIDQDITEDIVADVDDGYEYGVGAWHYTRAVHYFGYNNVFHPGYRFQAINIAQGVTIDDATLTVNVTGFLIAGAPAGYVYGDDVDDAPVWANNDLPSGVTKTAAKTPFAPVGAGVKQIDVTAIVQEIVDRGGWAANQDMRFAMLATGGGSAVASIYDYSAGPGNDAELTINYTADGVVVPVMMYDYRRRR